MVTFLFTVIFDLTVAVEVGLLLAAIFFIRNMTELSHIKISEEHTQMPDDGEATRARKIAPPGVLIYRLYGALFFGIADKLESVLHQQHNEPEILILNMTEVISMDGSALHVLEDMHDKLKSRGKHLILCGPHTQPYHLMHRAGLFEQLGGENIVANLDDALKRANTLLSGGRQ